MDNNVSDRKLQVFSQYLGLKNVRGTDNLDASSRSKEKLFNLLDCISRAVCHDIYKMSKLCTRWTAYQLWLNESQHSSCRWHNGKSLMRYLLQTMKIWTKSLINISLTTGVANIFKIASSKREGFLDKLVKEIFGERFTQACVSIIWRKHVLMKVMRFRF